MAQKRDRAASTTKQRGRARLCTYAKGGAFGAIDDRNAGSNETLGGPVGGCATSTVCASGKKTLESVT